MCWLRYANVVDDLSPEGGTDHDRADVFYNDSASAWERALYAFLAEKQQRSGSYRTVEGSSALLYIDAARVRLGS